MRWKMIIAIVLSAAVLMLDATYPRAALDARKAINLESITIGGKIRVYPGAHIELRNVNVARLPFFITVRESGTVVIDGSAEAATPVIH
jgi:hypothetical protein